MTLKATFELNTETLDLTVSELDLEKGGEVSFSDLVGIRDHIDRVLEQRDRVERIRRSEGPRRETD